MSKKIAIIGRPNVGKSTLFNRLVGKKLALVHDLPGVTRDRREAEARLSDLTFTIIDTAGLDDTGEDELSGAIWDQTQVAIKDSDIIFFVIDAKAGVTPIDLDYAGMVRRSGKPVILLVNKAEGGKIHATLGEASALGLGNPIAISAEHGEGMVDLFHALSPLFEAAEEDNEDVAEENIPLQLAIVGRPNVGKSTLINKLIKEERLITADQPGVTRDSIALDWEYKGRRVRLIDTAGMRRKAKIDDRIEQIAVYDALRAVDYAHVVVLVLDHESPLSKQDAIIANRIIEEGRVLLIAINKWDLVEDKDAYLKDIYHKLQHILPQVKGVPCIPISAKTGKNLDRLLDESLRFYDLWNKRISTADLNRWLEEIVAYHPPPIVGRGRLRFKYMTQVKTRPPTFALFASKQKEVPESYLKYLQNNLREDFDLPGIPLRFLVKSPKNPYVDD